MTLQGKNAIVTGASSGIGKATAMTLGREGARVALCARSSETLQQTAAEMSDLKMDVLQMPCDVRRADQVQSFVGAVAQQFGHIDVLVNNAGTSQFTPLADADDQAWDTIIGTNLYGPYFMTSRVLAHMPDGGRIVNISSVLGKFGVPGFAAYSSSKHGIIGFTRAVALELAPRKITVNAVCPGWVDTAMARLGMERGAKQAGLDYSEYRRQALGRVPLGEMIEPEEVASLIHFLLTPAAANITGQAYNICGGQVMH